MASLSVPSSRIDGLKFNCNSIQDFRSFPVTVPSNSGERRRRRRFGTITMNGAATSFPQPYVQNQGLCNERMEKMIHNSVTDIIKNLKEAPLLVQVFNDGVSKTERAESWSKVTNKWTAGEDPVPEGIIFVEELEEENNIEEEDDSTKAWGVVVQGKGKECGGPQCYLLKTNRVRSGSGLGLFCTHFCLTKVKSFRESAMSQLTNCWLL